MRSDEMNAAYFLTSERLGFRSWSEDDLALALDLWGDPAVTRLIDARGQLSRGQVRERLEREMDTERAHGVEYWPIFLHSWDDHVGCCGLRPKDESRGVFEIGFQIARRHWGRGYASEAAAAVMGHAFGSLQVAGLFAGHHPENEVSARVLAKLGFRYTHDEFYAPTGLEHPSYLLTAEEYAEGMEAER